MALCKITVLGTGGVGKTAFTIQMCSNHFVEAYDATIENNYRRQVVIDDVACVLDILDTAGQEEYSALRAQWIQSGQGYIIMYSIDDSSSFESVKEFHQSILEARSEEGRSAPPVILVGNKCDLEDERVITIEEGKAIAEKLNCSAWFEASAKNSVNIEEVFFQLVRDIREREATINHAQPLTKSKKSKNKKKKTA